MDFNSKVKKLADTTTSPEVRSLCESFLSENTSGGNFYEALNSVKGQDEASRSFLMEGNNLWNEIKDREMEVSKKAAASLLESWSNKTTSSNAGTWIANSKIEEVNLANSIMKKNTSFEIYPNLTWYIISKIAKYAPEFIISKL